MVHFLYISATDALDTYCRLCGGTATATDVGYKIIIRSYCSFVNTFYFDHNHRCSAHLVHAPITSCAAHLPELFGHAHVLRCVIQID